MLKKKTTVIYSPEGLNSEQREFIEDHNGELEQVRFEFAEKFVGYDITCKLVRQVRKRQNQRRQTAA